MTAVQIQIPAKLVSVFEGQADVRGSKGGRGSAKTRTFAKMTAVRALMWAQAGDEGIILCGRQFMNSLADSSLEEIKAGIESEEWLRPHFDIGEKYIRTADGRISYSFVGLDRNINSIKSKARIRLAWIDEAEPVTEEAWTKLIPTLREEDSELWLTWNPERKTSATNKRFGNSDDPRTKIVEMNWRDNPWFPDILDRARVKDMNERPDQYEHIWEGDFVSVIEGAYFAKQLTLARNEGRIGHVAADPLMQYRAYWDIGTRDATAIWIAQFIGTQIRVLDYYEAVGQPLGTHLTWLRDNGYGKALCVLPHDGTNTNHITAIKFDDHIRQAGFEARVVNNQGKSAAMKRVEAARRLFPSIHINEKKCQAGIDAIGWYHEKKDEARDVGLGPEHDWCLAAGTQVLTPQGWRSVEDIRVHDEVLTPCGSRRILRSGVVRVTNKWATVKGICCTPEHRFFTSRGLVEAGALSSLERFWTRDSLGLSILAFLSATFRFGLKAAIISATPEGRPRSQSAIRFSFIAWFMRLCMVKYRRAMRSITSMMIHSITTRTTLKPCLFLNIGSDINQLRAIPAFVGSAGTSSAVTKNLELDAAQHASAPTTHDLSESAAPAYNLTVDVDECYFVRGDDGLAYLVSNSSHGSDAFGLMCVAYEQPYENEDDYPDHADDGRSSAGY